MMGFIKKFVFVLSGVLLIGGGFAVGKTAKVNASSKEMKGAIGSESKRFGHWFLNCTEGDKDTKKTKTCFLTQQVFDKSDGKDSKVLAVYNVRYASKENGKRELGIVEVLPPDVFISHGTSIITDKKLIAPGKYVTCVDKYCAAFAPLSSGDLETFLSGSNSSVAMIDHDGKQVNFYISKEGLREGIEALKKYEK